MRRRIAVAAGAALSIAALVWVTLPAPASADPGGRTYDSSPPSVICSQSHPGSMGDHGEMALEDMEAMHGAMSEMMMASEDHPMGQMDRGGHMDRGGQMGEWMPGS